MHRLSSTSPIADEADHDEKGFEDADDDPFALTEAASDTSEEHLHMRV
jgi:hypothetical protein